MTTLSRVARLSEWLCRISTLLAYLLPLTVIVAILRGWFDPQTLPQHFPALPAGTMISAMQGALVALIGVLSVYPLVAAFLAMRSLFGRYRRGEILTDACASDILRIGRALIVVAATMVIAPMLQLLTLSWNSLPGGRILSVGVDGGTLGVLLSGGLLFTIGWVMREAARAAQENAGFV